MPKLTELPIKEFSSDMIDNCFYVDMKAHEMYKVKLSEVFNWIKDEAIKNGLSIYYKDGVLHLSKK